MVTMPGDITTRTSVSCVSHIRFLGKSPSRSTWSKLLLSLIPFVPLHTPGIVQDHHDTFALATTMVKCAKTHHAISNTCASYAMASTPKSTATGTSHTETRQTPRFSVPTTIKHDVLLQELQGYDKSLVSFLVDGFKFGFRLECSEFQSNYAKKKSDGGQKMLDKELGFNRVSGPYISKPFDNFICSPLGLVPKKLQGEFRIIHDLSFPEGNSVNKHITRDKAVVQYESIENMIQLIKKFGVGALMAKLDIEDGYRNISIHPLDYHFLGFVWNNQYYFDKCLPMGASSACQLFEKLSTSLQWIMLNKYKASGMSHLIDDFFFIGPPSSQKCLSDVNNFENLCQRLGVPIKQS